MSSPKEVSTLQSYIDSATGVAQSLLSSITGSNTDKTQAASDDKKTSIPTEAKTDRGHASAKTDLSSLPAKSDVASSDSKIDASHTSTNIPSSTLTEESGIASVNTKSDSKTGTNKLTAETGLGKEKIDCNEEKIGQTMIPVRTIASGNETSGKSISSEGSKRDSMTIGEQISAESLKHDVDHQTEVKGGLSHLGGGLINRVQGNIDNDVIGTTGDIGHYKEVTGQDKMLPKALVADLKKPAPLLHK